jgi:hypothetical protein
LAGHDDDTDVRDETPDHQTAMANPTGRTDVEPRRGLSARGRLLGWILLLGSLAVVASLLVSRQVLLDGVDQKVDLELTHEASKFRAFASSNIEPEYRNGLPVRG